MQISAIQSSPIDVPQATGNDLDKDAFLRLLITQLRHQDPLSPMENEEFLAQLAQFSSLEQMQELNGNVASSMVLTQSLNNSAAAGLIGKHVRASGDRLLLPAEGSVSLGYYLPTTAASVNVTLYDSAGTVVRTLQATALEAGSQQLTWDGLSDTGERLSPGEYRISVDALDYEGESIQALSMIEGRVDGVTFKDGNALLLVDGGEIPLSSVLEIFIPTTEGGDD